MKFCIIEVKQTLQCAHLKRTTCRMMSNAWASAYWPSSASLNSLFWGISRLPALGSPSWFFFLSQFFYTFSRYFLLRESIYLHHPVYNCQKRKALLFKSYISELDKDMSDNIKPPVIVNNDWRIKVQKDSLRLEQHEYILNISSNSKSFFQNNPLQNLKVVDIQKYTWVYLPNI